MQLLVRIGIIIMYVLLLRKGDGMRFSVIMPVYNVERYLDASVNSVLNQTFTDFELILIDDASPDNCGKICDRLAERDKRIKVIHNTVNSGLGRARNTGFKTATGEFVLYMDSDDTWQPDTLEILNREADGFDITVFGVNRLFEDKNGKPYKTEALSPIPTTTASLKESGQLLIELNRAGIFPFAWNKAYKREFLAEIGCEFESTKLIEDFLYNIQLFQKSERIKVIENCLYNYRKPAHQTLASSYSPDFLKLAKQKFTLEKEFLINTGCHNNENLQYIYFIFIKHLLSYFVRNRSKAAKLSAKGQKQLIKDALGDKLVTEILEEYHPSGFALKVLTYILKTKKINLCYIASAMIDFIKN